MRTTDAAIVDHVGQGIGKICRAKRRFGLSGLGGWIPTLVIVFLNIYYILFKDSHLDVALSRTNDFLLNPSTVPPPASLQLMEDASANSVWSPAFEC